MQLRNTMMMFLAGLLAGVLAGCGGGGGGNVRPDMPKPPPQPEPPTVNYDALATEHLSTARFTTHQPRVLEQVGAHHAYARGLTGSGVRIGIEDTVVDYTQRGEFGSRVKTRSADGAVLTYWRPLGDFLAEEYNCTAPNPHCDGITTTVDAGNDPEAINAAVRDSVDDVGWPPYDDQDFVKDTSRTGRYDMWRWWEIPTPYGIGHHGTAVASTAAGNTVGVAPGATIIGVAKDLDESQAGSATGALIIGRVVEDLPASERRQIDTEVAREVREDLQKFDIINRSYGYEWTPGSLAATAEEWRWMEAFLPETLSASVQRGVADASKTILVYAAGNDGNTRPGFGASLPYYVEDLRGHTITVAATDPNTKRIAGYSDRCGPIPSNWNRSRHGHHFCLVAPGTVRALVPNPNNPGQGDIQDGVRGTSFAAPVVSGALALMMEHFRETRGNTAIVRRMMDTADRTGVYANSEIYGAGHLDLKAALSPVGSLSAGQGTASLGSSRLSTPSAFGAVEDRMGAVEVATFDTLGFPFWVPASDLVSSRGSLGSAIPAFDDPMGEAPGAGLEALHLAWSKHPTDMNSTLGDGFTFGFGPGSASVARTADGSRWGWGASFADGSYLGSRTSGAFGHTLRSGMVWASRSFNLEFGRGVTFHAGVTLAAGSADYEGGAMFEATPSLMSAASVRVAGRRTSLTLESPMRAESGTGTFRLETGHVEDGVRQREAVRVGLRPDGRELRATLRHDVALAAGRIAVEASVAHDAGHVAGAREGRIGLAWNVTW